MSERAGILYGSYRHFSDPVLDAIRKETFGEDIGRNSWVTVEEHDAFLAWLELSGGHHVLEVASGSGGPSLHLARRVGCRVTGVDADEGAVVTATRLAAGTGAADRVRFQVADASARLPFESGAFDAVLCLDAMRCIATSRSCTRSRTSAGSRSSRTWRRTPPSDRAGRGLRATAAQGRTTMDIVIGRRGDSLSGTARLVANG
jgi:SAM-dependent methyltransferase